MRREANKLTATDLQCVRGDAVVFSQLNLEVESATVLQLEGGNGSGKTSLLRILGGLAQPETGEVRWNAQDIRELGKEFQHELAYLGHRRGVCEDLTPLENLLFADALGNRVSDETRCREALTTVALDNVRHLPNRRLSAGQNQRTALARLMIGNAQVWLLDEPFNALDGDGRRMVEGLISKHAAHGGICIVATHQPINLGVTKSASMRLVSC